MPLKQITPENAARLSQVCKMVVDGPTSFHSGIIDKMENPVAPMPALYPALIDEATAKAVALFII